MIVTSGWAAACCARCSPPPKPISSHSFARGIERGGEAGVGDLDARQKGFEQAGLTGFKRTRLDAPERAHRTPGWRWRFGQGHGGSGLRGSPPNVNAADQGEFRFQSRHQIGTLPRKTAFGIGRAAEVAIGGGALIDRALRPRCRRMARGVRPPISSGSIRSSFSSSTWAGAVGVDIEAERPRHADGVGHLQGAFPGQAGGDDVFSEIAQGIGRPSGRPWSGPCRRRRRRHGAPRRRRYRR